MKACLKNNDKIIRWSEFIKSFEHFGTLLINAPILQYPDFLEQFILTTDSSNYSTDTVTDTVF